MKHRRRKTALLTAAAAAVLALQDHLRRWLQPAVRLRCGYMGEASGQCDGIQRAAVSGTGVQPDVFKQPDNLSAGRDTKNAKEVQDKQYNQANDLYDNADNLRDQADQIEDFLGLPGSYLGLPKSQTTAGMYASLMSASILLEQNALKTQQTADASYRDSEMDRLDILIIRMRWLYRCSRRLLLIIRLKRQFR